MDNKVFEKLSAEINKVTNTLIIEIRNLIDSTHLCTFCKSNVHVSDMPFTTSENDFNFLKKFINAGLTFSAPSKKFKDLWRTPTKFNLEYCDYCGTVLLRPIK